MAKVIARIQPAVAIPPGVEDLIVPKGMGWTWLVLWLVGEAEALPSQVPTNDRRQGCLEPDGTFVQFVIARPCLTNSISPHGGPGRAFAEVRAPASS